MQLSFVSNASITIHGVYTQLCMSTYMLMHVITIDQLLCMCSDDTIKPTQVCMCTYVQHSHVHSYVHSIYIVLFFGIVACLGATSHFSLYLLQGHFFKQTKQNSVLHVGHVICLHPDL